MTELEPVVTKRPKFTIISCPVRECDTAVTVPPSAELPAWLEVMRTHVKGHNAKEAKS